MAAGVVGPPGGHVRERRAVRELWRPAGQRGGGGAGVEVSQG